MYANVSFDAVAADEDTTRVINIDYSGLGSTVIQRYLNSSSPPSTYNWPALFLSFFSIIGVVGNLLVCLAIATERRLQSRTNWFLLSLALADMLVSGLVIPLAVLKDFTGSWRLGPIICDLWIFLDVCSCTSSIMHIVVISIDRYLAIHDPLNTRSRQQKCKILLLIIIIWLIAILLSSPLLVLGLTDDDNIFIQDHCVINNQFFVVYGSVISFVIPLIIVIIMYTLTVRRLKEQIRQCQTQLTQEQLARAASLVAKPFLRRHIPTRSAAAAAAAASSSQSTPPITASALRRMRLRRQLTSLDYSEDSADNISLQQQQKQQQQHHQSIQQLDEESQIEEKPVISRDLTRQVSTKFSPHTEYACPKNPFCQLKCTCNNHQQEQPQPQPQPQLETVLEPKSCLNCLKHIRCCTTTTTTPPSLRHSSPKLRPTSLPISATVTQSSNSSNRSIPGQSATKSWRRLTITPGVGQTRTKSSAVRNEQKAVKVLGVVFAIFVIAWFPFCIMNLLQAVCKKCVINTNILNGLVWLGYVSSTINPLVYTVFNRNFRLKFIDLLKCHCVYQSTRQRQISYYHSHSSVHGSRVQRKHALLQTDIRRFNTCREQQEFKLLETIPQKSSIS